MHDIPTQKKPKKQYEGLKGKLIHLHPKTFNVLDTAAKIKGLKLKKYIELLCFKQAQYEVQMYLDQYEKNQKQM